MAARKPAIPIIPCMTSCSRLEVLTAIARAAKHGLVIPGRCEASNPESRDSGSGPSEHPGMTEYGLLRRGACHRARIRATRWLLAITPETEGANGKSNDSGGDSDG